MPQQPPFRPPFRAVVPPVFPVVARPVTIPISPPAPIAPTVTPIAPRTPVVIPTGPIAPPIAAPLVPDLVPARPAATRARFDFLISELHRLRTQMSRCVHQCGKIFEELSTPDMLALGGETKLEPLLKKYGLPGGPTATKYLAIAQELGEDQAAELGVERSYALIRAAKLQQIPITPAAFLARKPTIRVGADVLELKLAPIPSVLEWVDTFAPQPEPPRGARKQAESTRDKLARKLVSVGIGKVRTQVRPRGEKLYVRVELDVEQAEALRARLGKN